MCNNVHQNEQGEIGNVRFFYDGKQTCHDQACMCLLPIGFVGNSKDGSCPFGTVCDLRVYPYLLKKNQIETISNYHPDLEFEMPDKYMSMFVEIGFLHFLILDL